MYKFERYRQLGLADFNQPAGLKMNPENRWVKKAETIPWDAIEEKYAKLFPSKTGMPAKPLRMALGSLLIQKQLGFSDRELVEEITENPYFQYFIGLPGYQMEAPFVPGCHRGKVCKTVSKQNRNAGKTSQDGTRFPADPETAWFL